MKSAISFQNLVWQSLRLRLGFVISIVSTMGLAFGALLCVSTLAYFLLLKPLPYEQQESLFKIEQTYFVDKNEHKATAFNYPTLLEIYKNQDVFSELAMILYSSDILTSHLSQPTVSVQYVTPEWFTIADVKMALGRPLSQEEGLSLASPVAVISYETWNTLFNLNDDILNKKLDIYGVSFSIVGVISESYYEPEINKIGEKTAVWLPWDFNTASELMGCWGCFNPYMAMIGKLKPEYNEIQAEQLLALAINDIWKSNVVEHSVFDNWTTKLKITTFSEAILGDSQRSIKMLIFAAIGLVLIATANISNLFISRLAEQQQKFAIRAAVGADRKALFKLLLSESGQLMFLAILFGIFVTGIGFELIRTSLEGVLPRVYELSLSYVTIGVSILVWLIFSLLIAFICISMINYKKLNLLLQSSGKGTGIQVSEKLRKALVIAQVSIVSTLIFVNASLFQSALTEINKPLGFKTENIYYLALSNKSTDNNGERNPFFDLEEIKSQILALPNVVAVSRSSSPLSYFEIWSFTEDISNMVIQSDVKSVSHEYFSFIEQPLLSGEIFSEADYKDQSNSIVVNEVFAKELSLSGDVVGVRLTTAGGNKYKIVAVVESIRLPGSSALVSRAYPIASLEELGMLIKVNPQTVLNRKSIVETLNNASGQYSIYQMQALEENKENRLLAQSSAVSSTAVISLVSFILAMIGIYGVQSYSSQMRKVEYGIRMSVGATSWDLIKLSLKETYSSFFIGIGLSSLILSLAYLLYAETVQAYFSVNMMGVVGATIAALGVIMFVACYLPIRRYINSPVIFSLK